MERWTLIRVLVGGEGRYGVEQTIHVRCPQLGGGETLVLASELAAANELATAVREFLEVDECVSCLEAALARFDNPDKEERG